MKNELQNAAIYNHDHTLIIRLAPRMSVQGLRY
jgi:hypothetical protein